MDTSVKPMILYEDRETGELLTKREMMNRFAEIYDGEDDTNLLSWGEYFEEVRV